MQNTTYHQPRTGLGGGLIVLAGVWLLLDQLGLATAGVYWPLFWVIAGLLIYLLGHRGRFITVLAGMMVLGGVLAQLNVLGLSNIQFDDVFWPVLLILLGLSMLSHRPTISAFGGRGQSDDQSDRADYTAVFGGHNHRVTAQEWQGGEANAIFGELKIDLRDAKLAPNARLEASAVFGSIKIMVSKEMRVDMSGTPVFGTVHDRTVGGGPQTLKIKGEAVFGAIEIRN